MSTPYNQIVGRAGSGYDVPSSGVGDALVPEPLATSIIQQLPTQCAALQLMKKTVLSTKTQRLPVLDVLPVAYWVGGDTGLKQTSDQAWKNVVMVVEELACIIPIPQAYLDDADVPIWDEVQPRMTEAAGRLIDAAVFWGINKPVTWGMSIFGGVQLSGNMVTAGTNADMGQDVTALGDLMSSTQGYDINGFAGRPGLNWHLSGLRSSAGIPLYQSVTDAAMTSAPGANLYGFPIALVKNGSWQANEAQLLMGDWDKAILGIRQDISFKMFTEGVVSDNTGKVILNLMQQDAVAMRMVMRLAYAAVTPVTVFNQAGVESVRWPFGAITTAGFETGQARVDSTGTATTNASTTVGDTHAVSGDGLRVISGTGIPANSYVVSVTPGTGYVISQAATATGTPALTLGGSVSAPMEDPAAKKNSGK